MKSEVSDAARGTSQETEPTQEVQEQKEEKSFQDTLMELVDADRQTPKAISLEAEDEEAEIEDEPEETPETPAEGQDATEVDDKDEEPVKVEGKKDEWPTSAKQRVAEEADKRKRANERADRVEAENAQLKAALARNIAPQPTYQSPLANIQDLSALDRLERDYETIVDIAENLPEDAYEVPLSKDKSVPVAEFMQRKRQAERALRKDIPKRREYLQQRANADAAAIAAYPDLNQDGEFRNQAGQMVLNILNGTAQNDPELLIWVARAIRGWKAEQSGNGKNGTHEVQSSTDKIVKATKQKIAPTATKTRSFAEGARRESADLKKAEKAMQQRGDAQSNEDYVAAVFAQRQAGIKRVEPIRG